MLISKLNRTLVLRTLLGGAAAVLLMAAYARTQAVPAMTDAAKIFVNSLWDEQKGRATFKFEDEERMNWFYTPVVRKGLPLREMSPGQRQLALSLINSGLSQRGFSKAVTIMSLDEVLRGVQGDVPPRRDSDGYLSASSASQQTKEPGASASMAITLASIGPSWTASWPARLRSSERIQRKFWPDAAKAYESSPRKTIFLATFYNLWIRRN